MTASINLNNAKGLKGKKVFRKAAGKWKTSHIFDTLGAEFWTDAAYSKAGEQWALNRGSGGQVLRAKYGSVARAEVRNSVGLVLPGTAGNYANIPDPTVLSGATELDIRFVIERFDTATAVFAMGHGTATTPGNLTFAVSISGNTTSLRVSDGTTAVLYSLGSFGPFITNGVVAVRVTWVGSTGVMSSYAKTTSPQAASTDIASNDGWTSVGSAVTATAVLQNHTGVMSIGAHGTVASSPYSGIIHAAQVATTLNGIPFFSVDFTTAPDLASSFTCSTGQTVTVAAANAVDTNDPKFLPFDGQNYLYHGETNGWVGIGSTILSSLVNDIEIVQLATVSIGSLNTGGRYVPGHHQFYWGFLNGGFLRLVISTDGTNLTAITSTASVQSGSLMWAKRTRRASDGVCQFFTAPYDGTDEEPTTWTKLGDDVVGPTGSLNTPATSGSFSVGGLGGSTYADGVWIRTIIRNGIDGTVVVDASASSASSSSASFICTTGQTMQIARAASGRKATLVTRPVWLFGTDDYFEVADNDLLDFGDDEPFTVVAILRMWAPTTGYCRVVSKRTTVALATGYDLTSWNTAYSPYSYVSDGSNAVSGGGGLSAATGGSLQAWAFVKSSATVNTLYQGNTTGLLGTANLGSVSNAEVFRIGSAANNAGYSDMELLAVGVFRRALTAAEIATIVDAYGVT